MEMVRKGRARWVAKGDTVGQAKFINCCSAWPRCPHSDRRTQGPSSVVSLMLSLSRILFEALAGLVQEFRGESENNAACRRYVHAQDKLPVAAAAVARLLPAIPGDQATNRSGVPQVMQSRLITAAVVTQHTCANAYSTDIRPGSDGVLYYK